MAARLIDEFGSLAAAAAGSARRQLAAADGQRGVVATLRLFQAAMEHALLTAARNAPVFPDAGMLLRYLRAGMAPRITECMRLLHLDSRNMLIRDEMIGEGTIDRVTVHVREVLHRALDLGSASLILVHNHPSGDPSPSTGDIELTRLIDRAARPLGIVLLDHLVIGRFGHVSLRALGLMAP